MIIHTDFFTHSPAYQLVAEGLYLQTIWDFTALFVAQDHLTYFTSRPLNADSILRSQFLCYSPLYVSNNYRVPWS